MSVKRLFLIVLDSYGIGSLPDAGKFGDEGANTLASIVKSSKYSTPNMEKMGLFNIDGVTCREGVQQPISSYGRMREASMGKDTTIGHWEIAGVVSPKPMPVYPEGFPEEVLKPFREQTGRGILCNKPYSGTEVIRDYGEEHIKTGDLIVYTSADSVFQIAAHNDVIPLEELYRICDITRREVCVGPYEVGRIIARPFIGTQGHFVRTGDRRDYSRLPKRKMVFSYLSEAGYAVIGVGKIGDIYAHIGLTESYHTANNHEDMEALRTQLAAHRKDKGLLMANFVDFDSMYGHRRNVQGYADCLEAFDQELGQLLTEIHDDELLVITSDHGNDPTWHGTDHTRERVPLLVYSPALKKAVDLGLRQTYADLGMTIMDNFGLTGLEFGTSFLSELR